MAQTNHEMRILTINGNLSYGASDLQQQAVFRLQQDVQMLAHLYPFPYGLLRRHAGKYGLGTRPVLALIYKISGAQLGANC